MAALLEEIGSFPESQRPVLQSAIDILSANNSAGVDAMAYSRDLMQRHGFTAAQQAVIYGSASISNVSIKKLTGRNPSLQEIMADRLFFIQPS